MCVTVNCCVLFLFSFSKKCHYLRHDSLATSVIKHFTCASKHKLCPPTFDPHAVVLGDAALSDNVQPS